MEEIMQFEIIKNSCKEEEENNTIEILYENEKEIEIYDTYSDKQISFVDPNVINFEFIKNKIVISNKVKKKYNISEEKIANFLNETLNKNYFITLNNIYIIYNENDLLKISSKIKQYCDFSDIDFEDIVGVMLDGLNSVLIHVENIENTASQYCEDEVNIGIETTLLHEMRHLMLDTNIFLPENIYPLELGEEEMVEKFCRETYDAYKITKKMV